MAILVTGGTGFIGSHTVVELLESGKEVVIIDNLSNSKIDVIDKIKLITGKNVKFYEMDYQDEEKLVKVLEENDIESVIHFAGFKAVGESTKKPIEYYINNVSGTLILLDNMRKHNLKNIVFSSSATVYGEPGICEYTEELGRKEASNPYGASKGMIERILEDVYASDNDWNIVILRYFNPIGAHESGLLGENPNGIPNNLMPFIQKVAVGELKELSIFGNDYDTKDGTGVRDYLHVVDLAKGHIKALQKIEKENNGLSIYNLGTGSGKSVLEIVETFQKVNGVPIPYKIVDRRPGDLAIYYANASKAQKELNWKAEKSFEDMCRDSWNYIQKNKNN